MKDLLQYLVSAGSVRVIVYLFLTIAPVIGLVGLLSLLSPKYKRERVCFLYGVILLAMFLVGIVVPFYFQGYSSMPISMDAALRPSGLPSFKPFWFFAYVYSTPWFGIWWLLFGAIFVGLGKICDSVRADMLIRISLIAIHVWLMFNIQNYKRISLILDT